MREADLQFVGYVLGEDYEKTTAISAHDLSATAIDAVFDPQADQVVCPACRQEFDPSTTVCPGCGLQFE